jgi:hypothetical protein
MPKLTYNPLSNNFDYIQRVGTNAGTVASGNHQHRYLSSQAISSSRIRLGKSGSMFGDNINTLYMHLGTNHGAVLEYAENDNYAPKSSTFTIRNEGEVAHYYGGGYAPLFNVSVTQRVDYAQAVAFQAWIQGKVQDCGELYGFWGGVFDEGTDAVDVTTAVGINCYNAFGASNWRNLGEVIGGIFVSEANNTISSTSFIGGRFTSVTGNPSVTNTIGVDVTDCVSTNPVNDYGIKIATISRGTSKNYAIYTAGGNVAIAADNSKLIFGTGLDATIKYDGTDLIINPKEVGVGKVIVSGTLYTRPGGSISSQSISGGRIQGTFGGGSRTCLLFSRTSITADSYLGAAAMGFNVSSSGYLMHRPGSIIGTSFIGQGTTITTPGNITYQTRKNNACVYSGTVAIATPANTAFKGYQTKSRNQYRFVANDTIAGYIDYVNFAGTITAPAMLIEVQFDT